MYASYRHVTTRAKSECLILHVLRNFDFVDFGILSRLIAYRDRLMQHDISRSKTFRSLQVCCRCRSSYYNASAGFYIDWCRYTALNFEIMPIVDAAAAPPMPHKPRTMISRQWSCCFDIQSNTHSYFPLSEAHAIYEWYSRFIFWDAFLRRHRWMNIYASAAERAGDFTQ